MTASAAVEQLSPAELQKLTGRLEKEAKRRIEENALQHYKPYIKQLDFHAAGATYRERLLMAANQSGKTLAGGMEAAMHATGNYPEWWQGRRFDRPTVAWVAGETAETVRDTVQRVLIGRTGTYGTGTIPKDCIIDLVPSRGVPEAIDIIRVQHVSGGASIIGIKSYSDGRPKFQGETLDWVWLDEEAPPEIYIECLTRTNVGNGPVWTTFTPLLGMSETVRRFLLEKSDDRRVIQMDIDEAEHFSPEERTRIVASYSPHEREARTKGIPVLGSGRVFPVPEESITCGQRDFPRHWPRIGGMDFGWDHPFAAVELVWDRDTDTVYVTRTYRLRESTPIMHAAALKPWGKLPWSWPRDGRRETLEGAGVALAKQYEAQGLDMLGTHAQFEDGSVSVEAGLMEMLQRMESGRFKVFSHLHDFFEEFRLFHRKDGRVVKEGDDILASARYALMMLRFARNVIPSKRRSTRPYMNRGGWMAA
jgi:phage terminase large subunit-like protein